MSDIPKKTPLWQAISNELRAELVAGRYAEGDKLPTEAALAARFGVNRHTVRQGIAVLVEEGCIRTRRGAGAFVVSRPTEYAIGPRVRFHENLLAAGHTPEKRILHLEDRLATRAESAALGLENAEPLCACHGISLSDGRPIALFESLFPIKRLIGITDALREHNSVTAALRACGVDDYVRVSTRLTAVRATAAQALHLQCKEGDPLLASVSVNVSPDKHPVEMGRTWFVGDRVTLSLETAAL